MSPRIFGHEPISFRRMPPVLRALIVANVCVFGLSYIVGDRFYDLFGLVSDHVLRDRWLWQPFSYLFVHGGLTHLLLNLFALWMFGLPVCDQWGESEFLKYYFLCGLGAAAAQLALAPHSGSPIIGASGSIYGLLVAFAMLYPDAVVYLYFLIPVKAAHMAILFGAIEFFSAASSGSSGIARFAHLGGMATGYLYIRWWWVLKVRAKAFLRGAAPGALLPRPGPRGDRRRVSLPEETGQTPMEEIDRILDKILVSGMESLTAEEKAVMRQYAEKIKGPQQ
jgi:membrane associated rhomboid family serine protease